MRLKLVIPALAVAATVAGLAFTATPGFAGDYWTHRHHGRIHHYYRDDSGYRDYSGYLDPGSGHYDPSSSATARILALAVETPRA
jgi:hypothetical protein